MSIEKEPVPLQTLPAPGPANAHGWRAWLADNVKAAVAYYVVGLLGLALVDPLGVASVLWPGLGVAIMAVFVLGYRVWPGLFASAYVVAAHPPLVLFDPGGLPALSSLGIAVGNVVQATVAVALVRRFVGWPCPLIRGVDVFRFLIICGPLCAILGATIAVSTLGRFGQVIPEDALFAWWSWWTGNTLGSVMVLPLLLVPFGRPRNLWRSRRRALVVPFVVAIVLVTGLLVLTSRWERARMALDFERQALLVNEAVNRNIDHYLDVLLSLGSLVRTMEDNVDGAAFGIFARERLAQYPGIQALGWDPVVTDQTRDDFVSSMRQEGYSNFDVTERTADGELVIASRRPRHVVVQYIEPLAGNEAAHGYDIYSTPERRSALDKARDQGELQVTAPVRLVQESGEQKSVLVILPYFGGAGTAAAGMGGDVIGYAVEVLRMGDILSIATGSLLVRGLHVHLLDDTAFGTVLASTCLEPGVESCPEVGDHEHDVVDNYRWHIPIAIGGRDWSLNIVPTPGYFSQARTWSAWLVPGASVVFTILTGAFLLMLSGRTVLDAVRARQLESKNTELERFTYSVSHDLKSPLITIRGYVDCLGEDLAKDNQADALDDIKRIDTAANSMMHTLEGLLTLSRAGRIVNVTASLDMNGVVREAVDRVAGVLSGVRVSIMTDLPPASGDRTRLVEVFQNLIENAAKFMGNQPAPHIEIGARALGDEQAYYVRDNGQGVAAENLERVFEAFERLDPDVPGTGLGLAMVRRIVELHGGRTWLDSAGQGRGCAVYLALPGPGAALLESV